MKPLVDMNLSPRWVASLIDAGWHAKHWSELGKANASDLQILSYDAANDYVVLKHDLDFGAILAITHGKKPAWCKSVAGRSALLALPGKPSRHYVIWKPSWTQAPS